MHGGKFLPPFSNLLLIRFDGFLFVVNLILKRKAANKQASKQTNKQCGKQAKLGNFFTALREGGWEGGGGGGGN